MEFLQKLKVLPTWVGLASGKMSNKKAWIKIQILKAWFSNPKPVLLHRVQQCDGPEGPTCHSSSFDGWHKQPPSLALICGLRSSLHSHRPLQRLRVRLGDRVDGRNRKRLARRLRHRLGVRLQLQWLQGQVNITGRPDLDFFRLAIFWPYWVITKLPLRGNCSIWSLSILARPFFVCYDKRKPNRPKTAWPESLMRQLSNFF